MLRVRFFSNMHIAAFKYLGVNKSEFLETFNDYIHISGLNYYPVQF